MAMRKKGESNHSRLRVDKPSHIEPSRFSWPVLLVVIIGIAVLLLLYLFGPKYLTTGEASLQPSESNSLVLTSVLFESVNMNFILRDAAGHAYNGPVKAVRVSLVNGEAPGRSNLGFKFQSEPLQSDIIYLIVESGSSTSVQPGDIVMYDASSPSHWKFPGGVASATRTGSPRSFAIVSSPYSSNILIVDKTNRAEVTLLSLPFWVNDSSSDIQFMVNLTDYMPGIGLLSSRDRVGSWRYIWSNYDSIFRMVIPTYHASGGGIRVLRGSFTSPSGSRSNVLRSDAVSVRVLHDVRLLNMGPAPVPVEVAR